MAMVRNHVVTSATQAQREEDQKTIEQNGAEMVSNDDQDKGKRCVYAYNAEQNTWTYVPGDVFNLDDLIQSIKDVHSKIVGNENKNAFLMSVCMSHKIPTHIVSAGDPIEEITRNLKRTHELYDKMQAGFVDESKKTNSSFTEYPNESSGSTISGDPGQQNTIVGQDDWSEDTEEDLTPLYEL